MPSHKLCSSVRDVVPSTARGRRARRWGALPTAGQGRGRVGKHPARQRRVPHLGEAVYSDCREAQEGRSGQRDGTHKETGGAGAAVGNGAQHHAREGGGQPGRAVLGGGLQRRAPRRGKCADWLGSGM